MGSSRLSGLDFGPPPSAVYHSVAPLALDTLLDLDAHAAEAVSRSLYAGGAALKAVLPEGHPVLWPEHFDVAVADNEVNYGVSAGDDANPLPYAYVGPWDFDQRTHAPVHSGTPPSARCIRSTFPPASTR